MSVRARGISHVLGVSEYSALVDADDRQKFSTLISRATKNTHYLVAISCEIVKSKAHWE